MATKNIKYWVNKNLTYIFILVPFGHKDSYEKEISRHVRRGYNGKIPKIGELGDRSVLP